MKTKNYPDNGLYVVTIKNKDSEIVQSDLRFIEKSSPTTLFIAPEVIFNGVLRDIEVPEPKGLELVQMQGEVQGMTANDFILNFSKILLNRK